MKRIFYAAIFLALSTALSTRVEAGPLTEQQARLKAAQFALGSMFGGDHYDAGPAVGQGDKSVAEILSHIRESLLAVRGSTSYCGVIREPTWILTWDATAEAKWFGGYSMLINARTGKVRDCRS